MRTRLLLPIAPIAALLAAPHAATPASAAPKVAKLVSPTVLVARQGHARTLVGVRLTGTARVVVRLVSQPSGKVVNTVKTAGQHAPGRVWLMLNATTATGFQVPAGSYTVQAYAVDGAKRRSNVLTRKLTLTLKPARGVLQIFTVPTWPSLIPGLAPAPGGQIVAAVGANTAPATAGLRAGDVIRAVGGVNVDGRGAWFTAMRSLPAGAPVAIDFDRAGVRQTIQVTPPPDWTAKVDLAAPLTAAAAAAPTGLAFAYAAARERLDAGDAAGASAKLKAWAAAAKASAPGELLTGGILAADGDTLGALGAYNRALVVDPTLSSAQFARGIAFTARTQTDKAIEAFTAAAALDPTDAVARAFQAYSHLKADQFDAALQAADSALALDPRYEEAHLARGLALIGLQRVPEGVGALKRGLVLLDDATRAQTFITANLEPNTK